MFRILTSMSLGHTRTSPRPVCFLIMVIVLLSDSICLADRADDALDAAKKAASFLTEKLSVEGGYLWRYSDDLSLREGEGVVSTRTVWVQPPGTPAVGEAFVRLYEATRDKQFLDAAIAAGEALRQGQMRSGGWQAMVEFEPQRRKKWAYRIDKPSRKAKDQSSLDDDKTQSALRFIMQLDRVLNFQDEKIHEMVEYALDGLLTKGQHPNGGFPQVWTSDREPTAKADVRGNFPDTWSRKYPGHQEYWYRYTLNDNLAPDVIRTLFLAAEIYQENRYREAAMSAADFLLLAHMPDPQPAWAQQYNFDMQPIWARKFEPPAITGGESQGVIETLMSIYQETGDRKYLAPIPKTLDYLKRSELPDGRLARFYELKTNRPLYFSKLYELTYDDSDLPTHYGFKVSSRVDQLRKRFDQLTRLSDTERRALKNRRTMVDEQRVEKIVAALDERGAWTTDSGMRYHQRPGRVIDMRLTVTNLTVLSEYLRTTEIRKRVSQGEKLFGSYCAACHQRGGQGVEGRVPPLDQSPWVSGSEARLIRIVLNGLRGPIEIQGKTYNLEMPAFRQAFKDTDIASILSYVRKQYGEPSAPIKVETVARIRKQTLDRKSYWTVKELQQIR